MKYTLSTITLLFSYLSSWAQLDESFINYSKPKKYKIGGISVSGTQYLDPSAIIAITGFKVGDEIQVPGDAVTTALRKLWDQGILGDIEIKVTKIVGEEIFFEFVLKERARLSKFVFFGIKQTEEDEIREKIKLVKGKVVTDIMIKNTQKKVRGYFVEKGFNNVKVNILQAKDSNATTSNTVTLRVLVNKGRKIKVDKVDFSGNTLFTDRQLRWKMKNIQNLNFYVLHVRKKYIKAKYEEDKKKLIETYNNNGYRDAQIVSDTVIPTKKNFVDIKINLDEGQKYYFRNISWTGNYIYDDKYLTQMLGIKKGDVYNLSELEKRTNYNPSGTDISSLYLDDGYLFFSVQSQEVLIEGDSIDVEMKMYEGPQATINKIIINGNTKTNDHVILREIRTQPGMKFSRADLIRTQREISTLGYFDPEQITINPKPNPTTGTVDIEYGVVEKPSDQIELSGGWGGLYGFIGTLGISFNNFSARNIVNFKKWSPLPAGDGQKLSLRIQANGPAFQSVNASFSEPWLGGRKPMNFGISTSYSVSRIGQNIFAGVGASFGASNNFNSVNASGLPPGSLSIYNFSISLGRRIKWPDDYFTLSHTLSYSNYRMNNYSFFPSYPNGTSNSIVLSNTLARNSLDNPTFPRRGSSMNFTLFTTMPWSYLTGFNYTDMTNPNTRLQQFELVEYYKVMFDNSWFLNLFGNLVMNARAHFGFIGKYNDKLNFSPFERFLLGGNGLTGFNFLLGSDVIGLRGYGSNSIGPSPSNTNPTQRENGGVVYNKFVYEIRYPISLSPMATVFVLAFAEGGNNWGNYAEYNPLNLKKSVGFGARIFMPAFGLIGVDYGFPLDTENGEVTQPFSFTIGQQIR